MEDFKCIRNEIIKIKNDLMEIDDVLKATYDKVVILHGAMDDKECWDGEAHLAAMAFLELTMQYHELLTNEGKAPVKQAYEDLEKYLQADDVFYDEWGHYQELLKV